LDSTRAKNSSDPLTFRDDSLKSVIRTMSTVLEDATNGFTAGEGALMRELLVRLADES
jgi:hypothetical protein